MPEDVYSHEKLTLFKYGAKELLPSISAPPQLVHLSPEEEKQIESDIKTASPFLTDTKTLHLENLGKEPIIARETAITFNQVSIISLPGFNKSILDYETQSAWQFEPHPNLEKETERRDNYDTLSNTRNANKNRLWTELEKVAKEVTSETGKEIDLKNLTPYQAVYLVYELITRRLNYEYLILDTREKYLPNIQSGEFPTSRPELIPLAITDPKKFKSEVKKLGSQIDSSTADKHIKRGFGVCRHISATASVLYETLKERQEGLFLNGSYLLNHNESTGEEEYYEVVGQHAYNLLVVENPPQEQDEKPHLNISVVDPTWALDKKSDYDYTWRRTSQAASFVREFGSFLGMKNAKIQATGLADQALSRLEAYMENLSMVDNYGLSINDLLADYASLTALSSRHESGMVLSKVIKYLESKGADKTNILKNIKHIPLFGIELNNKETIRFVWTSEFAHELSDVNFSMPDTYPDRKDLLTEVKDALTAITNKKGNIKSNGERDNSFIINGYLELCAQYMRGCLESNTTTDTTTLKVVQYLIRLGNKKGLRTIPETLTIKFNQAQDNPNSVETTTP